MAFSSLGPLRRKAKCVFVCAASVNACQSDLQQEYVDLHGHNETGTEESQ